MRGVGDHIYTDNKKGGSGAQGGAMRQRIQGKLSDDGGYCSKE